MSRTPFLSPSLSVLLSAYAVAGCTGPSEPVDAPSPDVGTAVVDGGPASDGGLASDVSALDAAGPEIRCAPSAGPYLVVTADDALYGGDSTLARLPIYVMGSVTGLRVLGVEETLAEAAVRTWDAASFEAPAGFDGTASNAITTFDAVTAADARELAQCANDPWDRVGGALTVRLTTDQTGEISVNCAIGVDYGGRGPEVLELACARGVPGWLGPRPNVSGPTMPAAFRLASSETHARSTGPSVDGFVATSAVLRTTYGAFPGETTCAGPAEWAITTGTHQLWRGGSSTETWSGPVAAGAEESANWLWQEPGTLPAGFCFPPGSPPGACVRPVISLTVLGTSSAGEWSWESDLFDCLVL